MHEKINRLVSERRDVELMKIWRKVGEEQKKLLRLEESKTEEKEILRTEITKEQKRKKVKIKGREMRSQRK